MSLHPDETLQRALLSTTSRLVGEFEAEGFLIAHAWPDLRDAQASLRLNEGPASRSSFVVSFRTEPMQRVPGAVVPNYSYVGEVIASYLSVLYGKRFDHHGLIEGSGMFSLPDLSHFASFCNPSLPHNSHRLRADYPIPLNLTELRRFRLLFDQGALEARFLRTFQICSKFYLQALQNFESDSEVAYLHLITAVEILSNFRTFKKEELLDEETKRHLEAIRSQLPDGESIANYISGKMLAVKRRFVKTIICFVDDDFFGRSECSDLFGRLEAQSFERRISAAYDLRSKYVHTGVSFGARVSMYGARGNPEVQVGRPVSGDKEFDQLLWYAPTFVGLERIVRYCLLRFAETNGGYADDRERS